MESNRRHRGPLCGAHNSSGMDPGTMVRGRSHPPSGNLSLSPGGHLSRGLGLSAEAKLEKCLRYAAASLPHDLGEELRSLISPQAIGVMVVMLGITAGAQLTPFGWA